MNKYEKQILKKIASTKKITLFFHEKPDGDALGSCFGIYSFVKDNFKKVSVAIPGLDLIDQSTIPEIFKITKPVSDSFIKGSLAIVVDSANEKRIFDQRYKLAKEIIKIDHHPDNDKFGDISYVQPEASSACQMITLMIHNSKMIFSKQAAEYLYTGLVTDTGRFLYNSTSKDTFDAASILINKNIDLQKVYGLLYKKTQTQTRAHGYILSNYEVTKKGVAYLQVSKLKHQNFDLIDLKNLVNVLAGIEGIEIWTISVYDDEEKIYRTSIRSRTVTINHIAEKYNGGGHKNASGVKLKSKTDFELLVKDLDNLLSKEKEQ